MRVYGDSLQAAELYLAFMKLMEAPDTHSRDCLETAILYFKEAIDKIPWETNIFKYDAAKSILDYFQKELDKAESEEAAVTSEELMEEAWSSAERIEAETRTASEELMKGAFASAEKIVRTRLCRVLRAIAVTKPKALLMQEILEMRRKTRLVAI